MQNFLKRYALIIISFITISCENEISPKTIKIIKPLKNYTFLYIRLITENNFKRIRK